MISLRLALHEWLCVDDTTPLSPPTLLPQAEIDFDHTPAFDPASPDPAPEVDFDQSIPPEWES
jgi:hypothetical protein